LEAIELLRNAPNDLTKPIREGGGVSEWLWKGGKKNSAASIDILTTKLEFPYDDQNLRYFVSFSERFIQHFGLVDERIEYEKSNESNFYYQFNNNNPVLNTSDGKRILKRENLNREQSILAQLRDPWEYGEITCLADNFSKIKLYREWSFGRYTVSRLPQKADMPNDMLESDGSNLGLVLNRLRREPAIKKHILTALQALCDDIDDYDVRIEGGTVQVFFQEGNYIVPATRLSDGTLRYLCLLAILCHPDPPPLVCIEEPELGLHPDILPTLADLLKEASTRCQLIVTTHSDILVDAMTDQPESVLICEKGESGTTLNRLNAEELKPWLEKYRLGELWTSGQLGGTRW
jgi:predicted ATPase